MRAARSRRLAGDGVITRVRSRGGVSVFRNLKVQPKHVALEQWKERINVHPVCTQEVRHLGEDGSVVGIGDRACSARRPTSGMGRCGLDTLPAVPCRRS
jgi:hypothetical protein